MLLVVFYFVLIALAVACSGSAQSNCVENECATIGATIICIKCQAGNVPINGICKPKAENVETCKKANDSEADQTCEKCNNGYFLYKNGCYQFGNDVARLICNDQAVVPGGRNNPVAGVCTECNTSGGFFKNPEAADTTDSCIACNDTTGVQVNGGNTYKGVQNCVVCGAPGTGTGNEQKIAACTACEDGFFVTSNGATCTQCKDTANCAKCDAGADKCTKCKTTATNKYFKDGGDGTGTCVNEQACKEQNTHFPKDDPNNGNKCLSCSDDKSGGIADCKTCTLKEKPEGSILVTCSSCTAGTNKPNIDGTKCIACAVKDCAKCNDDGTCAECNDSKKLSPLGDACLEKCPAGTYVDSNGGISVCTLCHNTCAECNGSADATACTACYPEYSLLYDSSTTGTCVKECTGQFSANCAEATCSAKVGGSSYCAQCKDGYAPIDGVCTEIKAPAGRNQDICTASGGKCTACKGAYALISDGCYSVNKLPGKSVCTAANDGKCSICANEQAHSEGKCPACSDGCLKCKTNVAACTECYSGYYLFNSKCFKCTNGNEADIKGVENCISCAPPTGDTGPVVCYIKNDGTSGGGGSSGGGSTNKSGLSTGAIAGIAVAAIVVVGGLVGFLCWWFLCRGKA
ncbi:VSP [Giardia lamblia P15]|uniref:VSP n=1 Tax=Giardia intestinalis (strain P15) TaxID=658858 RepID=E1F9J0_GIAIA|nr:VSP [Giardia lamblia P15]